MSQEIHLIPGKEAAYANLYANLQALDALEIQYNGSSLTEDVHNSLKAKLLSNIGTIKGAIGFNEAQIIEFAKKTGMQTEYIQKAVFGCASDGRAMDINCLIQQLGSLLVQLGNLFHCSGKVKDAQAILCTIVSYIQALRIAEDSNILNTVLAIQNILNAYEDPETHILAFDSNNLHAAKYNLSSHIDNCLKAKSSAVAGHLQIGITMQTLFDCTRYAKCTIRIMFNYLQDFKANLRSLGEDDRNEAINNELHEITTILQKYPQPDTDFLTDEDRNSLMKIETQLKELLFSDFY